MRFKDRLTVDQLNDLHDALNERRTNSTHLKVRVDILQNLLYDYGDLLREYVTENQKVGKIPGC